MAIFTLEEAKVFLEITTDTSDALLNEIVDGVNALLESYCGRIFDSTTYVEYYDGNEADSIVLDKWPVTSITSIYDDSNREFTSVSLIDPTYYTFYPESGKVSLLVSTWGGEVFQLGFRNVKITYIAGYTSVTMPKDLKLIAADIVSKKFKSFRDKRVGLTSISSGGRIKYQS